MLCMLIGSVTERVLRLRGIPCSHAEEDRLGHAELDTGVGGQTETEMPELREQGVAWTASEVVYKLEPGLCAPPDASRIPLCGFRDAGQIGQSISWPVNDCSDDLHSLSPLYLPFFFRCQHPSFSSCVCAGSFVL